MDFYPGNGTFDLMYYPYYGKFTHVSKGLASPLCLLGNERAGAAAQGPDVLLGYFGQMRAGTEATGTGITALYFCV